MKVLAIVHQADAGLGVFAEAIEASGAGAEEWRPAERPDPPAPGEYGAVITLGGAMHADQEREHPWIETERQLLGRLVAQAVPVLGVCLGAQLLAEAAGGAAQRARAPEIGWCPIATTAEAAGDPVVGALAPGVEALEWHSYEFSLPPGAVPLARSEQCLQAFRAGASAWGIQFHAEVSRRDLEHWLDDYRSDPDAVASGLDAEALRAQARERIAGWNELGRELCGRFLERAWRVQQSVH